MILCLPFLRVPKMCYFKKLLALQTLKRNLKQFRNSKINYKWFINMLAFILPRSWGVSLTSMRASFSRWILNRAPFWTRPDRIPLVNIRRKALLSSVGFRKRMTSRLPRSSICDSAALLSSLSDLFDFWWEILSHFLDHSSIDSNQFKQENATASVWRMFWCFKPVLTKRGKGPSVDVTE